jgi:DNA-binding GntR family transcriptional regulator
MRLTNSLRDSGQQVNIFTPYMAIADGQVVNLNSWSLHSDEPHYHIHRIHHVNNKPYLSRQIFMPVSLYPSLLKCYDTTVSCIDMVEQLSSRVVASVESDFQVIKATLKQKNYLSLQEDESVFYFYSRLYDQNQTIIATFHSYFPSSMMDFKLEPGEGMYV